jgi:hypothetical protein
MKSVEHGTVSDITSGAVFNGDFRLGYKVWNYNSFNNNIDW